MRLTEFNEMVHGEFGRLYGESMLVDYVLISMGGKTAVEAIEAGRDPREVWRALCAEFDVPRSLVNRIRGFARRHAASDS